MAQSRSATAEYLGLPGDNLNLFAVMDLFQQSETLEGFERALNDPESVINNLDLDGDGYVDYIMVIDYPEGNVHSIVLRIALDENEYQDVAVFVVEKLRGGAVQIQLIGDEALYGRDYIIEPIYAETPNPGYTGASGTPARVKTVTTTYYEVAAWPVINYIYSPTYVVYRSSWRRGYYPVYWQPWPVHYWHYYYGFHYPMYDHYLTIYRPWRYPRIKVYHTTYYTRIRRHSPIVIVRIDQGRYKTTYTRPEKKDEGLAHFERVRAHRTSVGTTTGRSRTDGVTAPAATTGRDAERRQPANVVNAPRTETRSGTARGENTETRQGRETQTSVDKSRSEGRGSTPSVSPDRNRNEGRSSNPPTQVQRSRSETRSSNPPATSVQRSNNSSRNESRSSTPATSVQRTRTESRSSTPPPSVQRSNNNSRNESRSSSPAKSVQQNRSETRSSTPATSVQKKETEQKRSESRSNKPDESAGRGRN